MKRRTNFGRALATRLHGFASGDGVAGKSPAELRKLAEQARARRDWNADAFYRRLVCAAEEGRAGNWIQYGHALKEAGFHARAEAAYGKALDILPNDPDLHLQLGHLSKVRGDFDAAVMWFEKARDLGHPSLDEIAFQLGLLRRVDNTAIFLETVAGQSKDGVRVYLSVPGKQMRESNKADVAAGLGRADYSYSFAMRGFIDALEELEIDHEVIQKPEFVSDIRERSDAQVNIHLGFYPPDQVRVLKGAYNVNCFAWEFDRLRTAAELTDYHAFADQAAMLDIADELWVPSHHGADAVRKSVHKPVHTIPAPVLTNLAKRPRAAAPAFREVERLSRALSDVSWQPLAIVPRMQPTLNGAARARQASLQSILAQQSGDKPPTLYLSVFNVHDFRKQIGPLLDGFLAFSQQNPAAILLLKVTTPWRGHDNVNETLMKEQVYNATSLIPPMVSDRVWLTDAVLTRDELNRLYDVAAFYLCTSYAEGQNLPLIEAMGRGVVPISVDHTAMADYINDANALIIPSEARPMDVRMSTRYGVYGLETNFVEAADVTASLATAAALPTPDYAARSSAAIEMVKQRFGLPAFAERLMDLINRRTQAEAQP